MNKKSFLKPRKIVGGLVGPLVLLAVFPAPANAYPRPGITERVSVASDGSEANSSSVDPAISGDGRYVAFHSMASNHVSGDTNGTYDVFVHDRVSGTTERVSVASDGAQGNNFSHNPGISGDGRYITFFSTASNLVPGDTNGILDVFVHDRATGSTERVSVASDGTEAISSSGYISYTTAITADGRFVAFDSTATNLVPADTNETLDVFVHDRATKATERVSVAPDGAEGNTSSTTPAISADGRYVTFASMASNLVPGDSGSSVEIFVHDRATGANELVSVAHDGTKQNSSVGSWTPAISADGRHVSFSSFSTNLVPGDTNGVLDIFAHDRATGATERVSVGSSGVQGSYGSVNSAISADGRYVAFQSPSTFVPEDDNGGPDMYVHDRVTRATERVSVGPGGVQAFPPQSIEAAISWDGRHVAFTSSASNLVPGDTNERADVFVHDRGVSLGIFGTPSVEKRSAGLDVSGRATFSGAVVLTDTDPAGDGTPGAGPLGADLTGASLTYRPEQEDLLIRLRFASIPSVTSPHLSSTSPLGAGAPAVLYGFRLYLGATQYQVRGLRAAATASTPSPTPQFSLYRCDPSCIEQTALTGSIGTTGAEVWVSLPLAAIGVTEGMGLTGVRAFTAIGEANPGTVVTLDETRSYSLEIPASRVELGVAPATTTEEEVVFTEQADLLAGDFSDTIPAAGFSAGTYRVWTRACLGDACGPAVFEDVAL